MLHAQTPSNTLRGALTNVFIYSYVFLKLQKHHSQLGWLSPQWLPLTTLPFMLSSVRVTTKHVWNAAKGQLNWKYFIFGLLECISVVYSHFYKWLHNCQHSCCRNGFQKYFYRTLCWPTQHNSRKSKRYKCVTVWKYPLASGTRTMRMEEKYG